MATRKRKRKKCKFGLRRDGMCRRTRCSRKLTKKGYCPKGAGSVRRGKRRTKRRNSWATNTRRANLKRWPASAEARAAYSGKAGYF